MSEQVDALREEGESLYDFLQTIKEDQWNLPTPFKDRTVNWVVNHLHDADRWAVHSITDPDGFRAWVRNRQAGSAPSEPDPLEGVLLMKRWWEYFDELCTQLDKANPNLRAPWFGPDMGIRMMATARQMETWSHGQDIYDLLGTPRNNTDRVKNICHIGVRTFGWTFVNRKLAVPDSIPYVKLTSPSGLIWEWNDPSTENLIEGSAVEFAHVVTQGRNIVDTTLRVTGQTANSWMSIAQCFAGPPEEPPLPGHRTLKQEN